jgi:thioredoxin-dependent peroxiredoxin
MAGKITFKGSPVTLVGRVLKTGAIAPEFTVTSQDLKDVRLADFSGKVKVLTSFPSLDTPVCDLQVKEFNTRASAISPEVVILGISKDLPFAQKRFCDTFEIKNITVVSDYKTSSFGINYGLLIKEMNLLARSVIILDKDNVVRYIQVVPELATPPDYKVALEQLEFVLKNPKAPVRAPLPSYTVLASSRGWDIAEDRKLVKEFTFNDFAEAKYFIDTVSVIAQEQRFHPVMTIHENKVKIVLVAHSAAGLTDNDFKIAEYIDEL